MGIPFSSETESDIWDDNFPRSSSEKLLDLKFNSFKNRNNNAGTIEIGLIKEQVEQIWPEIIGIHRGQSFLRQDLLLVAMIQQIQSRYEDLRDCQLRITRVEQELDEYKKL